MSNLKRDTLKNKIAEIILVDFYGRVQKYPRGKTISADPEVDQIINLIESVADKVIGEDEPKNIKSPPRGFSNPRFDVSIPRNNLRAEQRDTKSKLIDGSEK